MSIFKPEGEHELERAIYEHDCAEADRQKAAVRSSPKVPKNANVTGVGVRWNTMWAVAGFCAAFTMFAGGGAPAEASAMLGLVCSVILGFFGRILLRLVAVFIALLVFVWLLIQMG